MATGDDARKAGLPTLTGAEDRRDGWSAINRVMDAIGKHMLTGTHSWSRITNKPGSFKPSAHRHKASDLRWGYAPESIGTNRNFRAKDNIQAQKLHRHSIGSKRRAVYVDPTDGWLGVASSTERRKKDITPADLTLASALAVQVVSYRFKGDDETVPTEYGVIAEQLQDAGLDDFVIYDNDGLPDGVHYERLALLALSALPELLHRIETLEAHHTNGDQS
ncbi:MAG: tail fiber domain-containing protein [Mycetocola reblochoni]|uniref:tail fiber domain-containing protein n=1 Tax=Mycetocola reblochoni TaxID=331618 RepID=UPI003F9737AF